MEIIIVIVVIVVIIGIVGIVAGPAHAMKSGDKVGSAFAQAYRQEFGTAPSKSAESAVATACGIILNAMGGGQYALPSENLRKCIQEYGAAVQWNESKMELGLACMGAPCMTKNGNTAPGCKWAVEVIEEAMFEYCPTAVRRALRY